MKARTLGLVSLLALVVALLAAGCGGGGGGGSQGGTDGEAKEGGILRLGTTNYIDSLNPFNYIEAQAYNAFIMIYPQLVQYTYEDGKYEFEGDWAKSWETSNDGKVWTFTLHDGAKWSDGKPLTAEDAAWTINTTVKFADGPTAVAASALNFVKEARAVDPTTLEIEYETPIGNTLAQLEQFFVLPKHVYEPLAAGNGKGLKTFHPEQDLPMVSAGAYTIKEYEKKGTTVYIPDPNFWGPTSNAEAVAMTYYTNSDSMINDLRQGNLDWVDQVPWGAVDVLKEDKSIVVEEAPGAETTNITWNSNPYKPMNRELLDPRVKKALSMCIDREKIIEVVFAGYADTVESIVGHISPLENPNLGPLEYDCAEGNRMLDELGYERGADGIRMVPATTGQYAQEAHPMRYRIMQPTSLDFNGPRSFDVVKEGWAEAGVDVELWIGGDATAAYAIETGDPAIRPRTRATTSSTSPCGTGSATSTPTSCSPSRRRASGARGATRATTTPSTTSSTSCRARRSTRRSASGSSTRCSRSSTTTSSTPSSRTTWPSTLIVPSGTGSTCPSRATRRRTTRRRTRWAKGCGSHVGAGRTPPPRRSGADRWGEPTTS